MKHLRGNFGSYDERAHTARKVYYGEPGSPVETDLGVEVPWKQKPDENLGLFLMQNLLYDMLWDLMDRIEDREK